MLRVSAVIFSTLTPGPSSTSYRVTVGPRVNPVTAASMLNCSRTPVIRLIMSSLADEETFGGAPNLSRPGGGNWYPPAGPGVTTGSCLVAASVNAGSAAPAAGVVGTSAALALLERGIRAVGGSWPGVGWTGRI